MKRNFAVYAKDFEDVLLDNFVPFWTKFSPDPVYGGYLCGFMRDGELFHEDKSVWQQGRSLWMFSKLATMQSDMFSSEDRAKFLAYAKNGRDFLLKNVLIAPGDYRCVFLMEADGTPKYVDGFDELDMSISADCFVNAISFYSS